MHRTSCAAALLALAAALPASGQQSKLLNISSIGIIDDEVPHIACTILQNPIVLVVFAESNTGPNTDPLVLVSRLPISVANTIASNDDFIDLTATQRGIIRSLVGRVPNLDTDAAAVVIKESGGLTPVCAVSSDARRGNGPGLVNLQINDVTDNLARMGGSARAAALAGLGDFVDADAAEAAIRAYHNSASPAGG